MFHEIADSSVIIRTGGVYHQTTLALRNNQIYAKVGKGYVKLYKHANGSSKPSITWGEPIADGMQFDFDKLGVMVIKND